jgi:hypothetical protein
MPDALLPTVCFRVTATMRYPLEAETGCVLAVFRLSENLWVLSSNGRQVLRKRAYPERRLWSTLQELVDMGFIVPSDAEQAARFASPPRPVLLTDAPSLPRSAAAKTG